MTQFLTAFTIYLSIITTYVFGAFAAGKRLNKIQLFIVNTSFIISTTMIGYITIAVFRRFYLLASESLTRVEGVFPLVNFTWPLCVLLVALVVGSLVFMWQVRIGDLRKE